MFAARQAITDYAYTLRRFNHNVRMFLVVSVVLGFGYFGINGILFNLYLLRLGYDVAFVGLINHDPQLRESRC